MAEEDRATPKWANADAIRAFYRRARRLTNLTGFAHSVDHIVPLVSPYVCGLHCEANLRVEFAVTNRKKGNRWWPHSWCEQVEMPIGCDLAYQYELPFPMQTMKG